MPRAGALMETVPTPPILRPKATEMSSVARQPSM
jgi:hypothetical protein